MRFLIQLLVITILASIFELFLPWWSIALAAFIGGYFFPTRINFIAGFLSIAILWSIMAIIIEISAAAPLTERVAAIFKLSKPLLFVVTAVLGGLVGGFAAMAGGSLRPEKRRAKYY
jgi:hypothetical protein